MRDFFISSLEKLITVLVILMCIAVVVGAGGAIIAPEGGILAGIAVLVFGGLYVVLMAGMMYLVLGIHDNTKRTAEATERMVQSG